MEYDPRIHHRRSIRLHGYDHAQPGAYFVTICTYNRDVSLEVEEVREGVRSVWESLPARFPSAVLDEFVIMPNHIHGLIVLAATATRDAAGSAPTLGRIVRAFKSLSAIGANTLLNRRGQPFWQRNYYEHIVRDDDELNRIRQYVRDNPRHWEGDPENPSNR